MEQDIRFCELDGRRIAYATVGEGPPLVFGGDWVSHLEEEWDDVRARSFYEELARTTSSCATTGSAPGSPDAPAGRRRSTSRRGAGAVIDAAGGEPATVFACSCAGDRDGEPRRRSPSRVRQARLLRQLRLRDDLPEVTRRSLVDFVRVNWTLAAQMLAGLIVPHASGDEIAALSRTSAARDADVAAAFLELELFSDARPLLPQVTMPALVLHRRGDRPCRSAAAASSPRSCRTRASSR